jgi:beta-lactamase class C
MLPVMKTCDVPGMARGVAAPGHPHVSDYGVASPETRKPVTHDPLANPYRSVCR